MGMKILHTADWHLDSPFASLPEPQRSRMRLHQRRIPGMMAELCRREDCDLVLLAGDIFDGKPSRGTVDDLRRALADCGVPVCIAPGNHDFCGPDSPWNTEIWPDNVHIFKGDLDALDLPALNCRIYGGGFRSMDCPGLLAGFRAEGDARYCIGILHGDPIQPGSPCCPVTSAQVRESGLDYLALGHIHAGGSFRAGNTLCAWPGCPMGRGWDETGEKGVLLVTLDETAECTPVPLMLPQFHDIETTAANLDAFLPPVESVDCYRVTLTGTGKPNLDEIRARYAHLALLELRDETEEASNPWDAAGDDSLRGVFFSLLREKLEAASPEEAEIIALAAEISQKLLDGREVEL